MYRTFEIRKIYTHYLLIKKKYKTYEGVST
jgi:hypothetical protein